MHQPGQCAVNFENRFSFWREPGSFWKEASVVSCHQTKTELLQRNQDGRKRREEGQQVTEHSTKSRGSCRGERLGENNQKEKWIIKLMHTKTCSWINFKTAEA